MFASRDHFLNNVLTILAETNVINTFLASPSKFKKMCEYAPQIIFICKNGKHILKILTGYILWA